MTQIKTKDKKKQTSYSKCKQKIMDSYMKKYERGELKSSNEKIVKNRLQAVAIGLSMSEKICESKISKVDIEDKETRVNVMLFGKINNKNKQLLTTKLQLSNVKNAIFLLNYYNKHNINKKYIELKNNLLSRTLVAYGDNNLTSNVYKEIKKLI